MALRRISQLDPVLSVMNENGQPLSPKQLEDELKWIVQHNPLLSGYLMEVSEWDGIKENAPSYYLSKQFDLSSLIAIISAEITGEFDDLTSFTNWQYGKDTPLMESLSVNNMRRKTYNYGIHTFENNVTFHRNVTIDGAASFPNGQTSAVMTTGKQSWTNERCTFTVRVPSQFNYPINACSMSAWWADLAEIYDSDGWYAPGTLVQFGGEREITIATTEANAVVTYNPGLIINASEHVQFKCPVGIALTGRTPVRVLGKINKFDRIGLDPDNPGLGRPVGNDQPAVAVALESNDDPEIKLVMCSTRFTF